MPKKLPPEFKRDVVTVARRGDLSIAEVAADFGLFRNEWRATIALAGLQRVTREHPGRAGASGTCFPHIVRVGAGQAILALAHPVASTPKASKI